MSKNHALAFCLSFCSCMSVWSMEPIDSLYQIYAASPNAASSTDELLQMLYDEGYADSIDVAPNRMPRQRQYSIHMAMAYRFYDQAYYQEALEATQRAEKVGTEMGDTLILYDLASHHGSCSLRLGQFDEAIDQYKKSIDLGEQQHDASLLSSGYNNLAATYLASSTPENKLYETAYTYILKAIDYERQVPGTPALSIRYGMASEINVKRGQLDEAYAMCQKAYEQDSLAGNKLRMARRQSQMGDVLFAMRRLDEAEQMYTESLQLTRALGERNSTAITCKQLASLYSEMGKSQQAASYYAEGLNLAETTGNKYLQYQITEKLYELYKESDKSQALSWLEQAVNLKESLWNEHTDELLRDYQARYESMEKSATIEKQQREIRKRNIALSLSILLIIILTGYFHLMKYYRHERERRKKAEKQVKELESTINERTSTLMNDLTNYVLLHMDENTLSNEEICRYLNISNTNLNRQVNLAKGCSIQGYVQQLRMEKAERLLRTSEKTVSEIAIQCGYEDISYFSRVFKQRYGVAPTKYRQDAKG